ncbi:MAG: FHIPEP family type III secretion protein, partial [Armatimonadetes bacterium]|nr:FHIPEP family type III secretion protein [Armatimonadota bacterium]
MAVAAIGVVMMLLVPLPPALMDLLLVFNLAFSLSVLLGTTYLHDPLEFSVFPSLLLFTALFRLALSLSVMRAILSTAQAGSVVASFGTLVLGGNYVVGFVLFLTLVIVQLVVVTGGTSRIAEVVARFTLDAMPGKQMAIDADLNAGTITEEQARDRRRKVAQESDFYGAMDGASKFVRGDGIAALLVTAINLLGGIVVGVVQMKMDLRGSLETYALLTVGQGLVIQIPGLLMSTASGLIVTRAAAENNLSQDLLKQVTSRPETLQAAGMGCLLLGLVPGLPKLPLFFLAA